MREEERIDRICRKIAEVWKRTPDWRLFQMLINFGFIPDHVVLWNIEDEETEKKFDSILKHRGNNNES